MNLPQIKNGFLIGIDEQDNVVTINLNYVIYINACDDERCALVVDNGIKKQTFYIKTGYVDLMHQMGFDLY